MKVLLVGATGALGRHLVPKLVAQGHEVLGTTRSTAKGAELRALGAEPVVLDALDRDAVMAAVTKAEPEVIVHQATALSSMGTNFRKFPQYFALTNRLRTEGTDNLIAAAGAAGTRRLVAQSYAGWPFARQGGPLKTDEDPLDPDPPAAIADTLGAIRHLEAAVTGAEGLEGLVLRYGGFYGPGTSIAPGGVHFEAVPKRQFPIVGARAGLLSFPPIHHA